MILAKWQLKASQMPQYPTVDRDELVELINHADQLEAQLRHVRTQLRRNKWSESDGGLIHSITQVLADE